MPYNTKMVRPIAEFSLTSVSIGVLVGSGILISIAVVQKYGRAGEIALAWALLILTILLFALGVYAFGRAGWEPHPLVIPLAGALLLVFWAYKGLKAALADDDELDDIP